MTKKKDPSELKRRGDQPGGYYTYAEAKAVVQQLGITSLATYRQYTRQEGRDPRLPTDPAGRYKAEWEGWPAFVGKTAFVGLSVTKYATYSEASEAAQRLGIIDKEDYRQRHHLDPKLPATPHRIYADWPAEKPWFKFLGRLVQYTTLAQASEAARLLGCKTSRDYEAKYIKDPRLPRAPDVVYDDWAGWDAFLGKS